MDDLGTNDPYRGMETGEDSIQPDFLSKGKEKAQDILGAVEQVAAMKGGGAPGKANPNAAKGGASKAGESGANAAKGAETKEKDGLYSGNKNAEINEDNASGGDGLKEIAGIGMGILAPILILIGLFFGLIALVVGLPIMMIGAIDYNLQTALGFKDTVGVIEKQGEYVTAEMAMNGEFPSGYASDLAQHGIDVGQLTANGDFYKTNVYIANIEEKDGMVAAAGGFSYISDEEGELAMLYEGEIIKASEFVAKVESDPKLYAAYSGAANLSAKYYYGKDATEAFSDMGITRGEFNSLYTTGNYELDEENFVATLNAFLDSNSDLGVGGRLDDNSDKPSEDGVEDSDIEVNNDDNEGGGGTWSSEAVDAGIIGTTSDNTMEYITGWSVHEYEDCTVRVNGGCKIKKKIGPDFSDDATERATELLNSAVSASEPYQAANVFMAIEEPIQRARIGDNGPVNALMNVISKPSTVTYQNVQTGEMETNTTSILESTNFNAAVGEKPYSASEAANFAADRALLVAGMNGNDKIDGVIENTVVSSTGQSYSTSTSRNGKCWFFMTEEECEENKADEEVVSGVDQTLNEVIVEKNSNVFQSVIGANRVLQGGSYVSNTINKKALGSMPSDSEAIAKYDKVVEETVARKAEADRASLSPFDISSPNTFLGSIVHNLATMSLRNYSSSGGVSLAAVATSMTDNAISNLTNSASAEGMNQKFTTMLGTNCKTVKTTSTEGNLYCNSSNTNNTDYMDYTLDDWQETIIGGSIDEDGHILEDSTLYQFVTMGMDRSSTVGVKSAEVCEQYNGYKGKSFFSSILNVLSMYDACKGVDDKYATGAVYTRGPEGGDEGDGESEEPCEDAGDSSGPITWIGDSISNMDRDEILALLPEAKINAEDGKAIQYDHSADNLSVLTILKNEAGSINDYVVIQIGTNNYIDSRDPDSNKLGWLTEAQLDQMASYLTGKTVVVVTNYDGSNPSRFDGNNALIKAAAAKYGWTVADWAGVAKSSYVDDGSSHHLGFRVHLTASGKKIFAKTIANALKRAGYKTGKEKCATDTGEVDVELFTAYMLYSQVRALMNDEESSVALVRENYYAKHPKDNSRSGVLARISGMTKQEAEIALAYGEYLNEIANYDSSSRYHFGMLDLGLELNEPILKAHSEKISGDFVAWYTKETEYSDLRTRNFVV